MSKDDEDRQEYILMPIEAYEAKEGATEDIYRELSKEEGRYKRNRKLYWLILLIGGLLIGIGIEIIRAYR